MNSFLYFIRFNPDIILIVANSFKYVLLGKLCSVISAAKLVREKSEVPFYKYENISAIIKLRIKAEFKLFDGLIVISESLESFFLQELSLKVKILKIPILVNISNKTLNKCNLKVIKPNLVYTGSLINNKDGVLIIIQAFAIILKDYPHLRLIMTGDIDKSADKEKILTLINKLNVQEKVELTGYISEEKLHEITSTASALLLAKPENRQNNYNMATKIGEYLLTGRPVVISYVDPVCRYLLHRGNAFIIKPDKNQIAQEIEFILDNSKEADSIGLAGKEFAIKFFDYKIHALRMNVFFKEL